MLFEIPDEILTYPMFSTSVALADGEALSKKPGLNEIFARVVSIPDYLKCKVVGVEGIHQTVILYTPKNESVAEIMLGLHNNLTPKYRALSPAIPKIEVLYIFFFPSKFSNLFLSKLLDRPHRRHRSAAPHSPFLLVLIVLEAQKHPLELLPLLEMLLMGPQRLTAREDCAHLQMRSMKTAPFSALQVSFNSHSKINIIYYTVFITIKDQLRYQCAPGLLPLPPVMHSVNSARLASISIWYSHRPLEERQL